MHKQIDLIGDGIENPWNAKTLIDIAGAFGSQCFFRDRKHLDQAVRSVVDGDMRIQVVSCNQVLQSYAPLVALENLDDAASVFGFKLPPGQRAALIAGNEKFGLAHDMKAAANHYVQIPMFGTTLNTLNVASAAGVALFYLSNGLGGKLQLRSHAEKRRPEILFMGPADHIELGSAIRSAGAFGWNRLILEDREEIWFGCDRVTRSEGRGAARRGRNSIRLVPASRDCQYMFKDVVVVSAHHGTPITKANLACGAEQLIVMPDESQVNIANEDWQRFGANVHIVKIHMPSADYTYHYRLFTSIALAETARQVGQKPRISRPGRQGPVYESSLSILMAEQGEEVFLEDLSDY